ncbi:MAG: thioredoxin family protein [Nitrospirota bacterium]
MKIDCYLSEHCGSYHQLRENIDRALAESDLRADVAYHTIRYDEAVERGVIGSPSIWVNGKDLFEVEGSAGLA